MSRQKYLESLKAEVAHDVMTAQGLALFLGWPFPLTLRLFGIFFFLCSTLPTQQRSHTELRPVISSFWTAEFPVRPLEAAGGFSLRVGDQTKVKGHSLPAMLK